MRRSRRRYYIAGSRRAEQAMKRQRDWWESQLLQTLDVLEMRKLGQLFGEKLLGRMAVEVRYEAGTPPVAFADDDRTLYHYTLGTFEVTLKFPGTDANMAFMQEVTDEW